MLLLLANGSSYLEVQEVVDCSAGAAVPAAGGGDGVESTPPLHPAASASATNERVGIQIRDLLSGIGCSSIGH